MKLTYMEARDFEASRLWPIGASIIGIQSPQFDGKKYEGIGLDDQWRLFFRECRELNNGEALDTLVQVEDEQNSSAGNTSGWLSPNDAIGFVTSRRAGQ